MTQGGFAFDAVFEFALASNYWHFGTGSPRPLLAQVDADVAKCSAYLQRGLAHRSYVVVKECDHAFPARCVDEARSRHRVEVVVLRQWTGKGDSGVVVPRSHRRSEEVRR